MKTLIYCEVSETLFFGNGLNLTFKNLQYDKNRIAATRMRIIRILKDWTNDGAKLKYVVTTEEAKNMDKFVAEKNKSKKQLTTTF